jgi:pyruvate dehydrogenase E1 component alpha subunit
MYLIRRFEEAVSEAVRFARAPGFVHLYVGQEAIAVGVCAGLKSDDYVTSSHRADGHLLAKGADPRRVMAELYGRVDGYCRGKGGSMQLAAAEVGVLGANGIVGASLPMATGAALSARVQEVPRVVVCFFGEGASNRGEFGECLNLASIWKLPVVFVCENNGFTEFTRAEEVTAGSIASRAAGYDVPGVVVDGTDVRAVYAAAGEAVDRARDGGGPSLLECQAWRLCGHEEGEEAYIGDWSYRSEEEWQQASILDPIIKFRRMIDEDSAAGIEERVKQVVEAAVRFAEGSPYPEPDDAFTDIYAPGGD